MATLGGLERYYRADLGGLFLGTRLMRGPAIALHDLTLGYDGHPAVHHLSGTFEAGSLTAICGPNGAGKSTLIKCLGGALPPLDGRIERGDTRLRDIACLPQSADIDRTFPIDVEDMAATGLLPASGFFGRTQKDGAARVRRALERVRLAGLADRHIGTLSGGQLQRLLFARVMVQDASLILLDEPFTALDAGTVTDLMTIIAEWHADGRTIIAVLHDLDLVRAHFPQTLLVAREPVAWGKTALVLNAESLARARRMTEAFDAHAQPCVRAA